MEVSPRRKRVSCFFRGNSWRRDETMSKKPVTHRVVTFLTREELDFLDKLEKDVMFSSGKYISRSQILQDMAELLAKTKMNATGIKDNQELKSKIQEAIAKLYQEQENSQSSNEPGQ